MTIHADLVAWALLGVTIGLLVCVGLVRWVDRELRLYRRARHGGIIDLTGTRARLTPYDHDKEGDFYVPARSDRC